MTIAIDATAVDSTDTTPSPTDQVAAVLYADRVDDHLVECILAVADQTQSADLFVLLDATPAGDLEAVLARNEGLREQLPPTHVLRTGAGIGVRAALREVLPDLGQVGAIWLLTGRTAPAADALRFLRCALLTSTTAGVVAPKLVEWDRPNRLQRYGIQATRGGRLRFAPRPGEPDQQQYDDAVDTLACPAEGMLIRREVYAALAGHEPVFGDVGGDLDLGWRAQQAGHRVVLAARSRVRLADAPAFPPTSAQRRAARQVALTRCPLLLSPFLAIWVALSSAVIALGLLLLKRPRAAAREATDLGSLLTPWRVIAARWRSRGRRAVRGRDIRGLFVSGRSTLGQGLDRLHDVVVPHTGRRVAGDDEIAVDPDTVAPMADPAESGQSLRNPGLWAVLFAAAVGFAASRTLPLWPFGGFKTGISGGQLSGARADSAQLWHGWWDSWTGPGLGSDAARSSGLAIWAVLTWVWQHLPLIDTGTNPAGSLIALFLLAALPLAALSVYVSAATINERRWPRALAALAWACSPVAGAALGQGRLGALIALILLPILAAGFGRFADPRSRPGVIPATALVTAALAAFVPGTLILAAVIALGILVAGNGFARRRAVLYLLLTAVASAPVIRSIVEVPAGLATGWGLTSTNPAPPPWQLALLRPEAITGYWTWIALPIVVLGVLGLLRPLARTGLAWAAAGLSVVGFAIALVLPRIQLGRSASGEAITGWTGLGLLVATLGLLAAALLSADGLDLRGARRHVSGLVVIPAVVVAVLGTLGVAGALAWTGVGTALHADASYRPPVAVDQSDSGVAGRTLHVTLVDGEARYAIDGREPGALARDLPTIAPVGTALSTAIGQLLDEAPAADADPAPVLADWGIGFVVVDGALTGSLERRLDATAELSRIGDHRKAAVWRVEPAASGPGLAAPSRLRLDSVDTQKVVPVTGEHAVTRTRVEIPNSTRLVVAEPSGWARHATVRVDGSRVNPIALADGRTAYDLPSGTHDLRVGLAPHHRMLGWIHLLALLVIGYLALPLGAAPGARRGRS